MTNPWSETTSVTFDTAGRVNRKDLPNGMYETYHFDSRSRVDEIKTYNSSGVWQDTKAYVWDEASRITQATEGGVATTYGYDDIDQLLSESRSGYSASYTYDANGNRLTRTVGGTTETYHYDDADKLTYISVGETTTKEYEYDDAGRTTQFETSAGITSFTYDYESRVTSITYPNLTSDSHTYNGLGARVGSSGTNGSKTFRRSGIGVTSPVMSDGALNYTPGVSSRSGSTSKFQHSGIKNATEQSNSSQSVTATKKYDAFGNLASSSGSWQGAYGYGGNYGYQEDASGLKLLGHRYYDSSSGRFLSRDPSGDGANWYSYAGNNPITGADPDGLRRIMPPGVDGILKFFGAASLIGGIMRQFYVQEVRVLPSSGRNSPERNALKDKWRKRTPEPFKTIIEHREKVRAKDGFSPNKTNAGWNRLGAAGRYAGPIAIGAAAVSDAYELASSDNKPRTAAGIAGSWGGAYAGGLAGAKVGAAVGALFGGVGAPVGAVVGGLIGAAVGGWGGRNLGEAIFDWW